MPSFNVSNSLQRMRYWLSKSITVLLYLGILLGLGYGAYRWYEKRTEQSLEPPYRLASIEKGNITRSITANGTLNPVVTVNVGTQVSGTILRLHTDFNQRVKRNQVLAELDDTLIRATLAQLEANRQSLQAQLTTAKRKLERTQQLVDEQFVSAAQLDDDLEAVKTLQAQIAAVQAQLSREQANLRFTIIRSPIDGVIIARNVDSGQTVAASFQTPTLFQIAQDLSRMQIDTSIPEADIASLKEGLKAEFSVDALPGKRFQAQVRQVRLNPTVSQNVVTYNVILNADNTDGALLPGMTANVKADIEQRENVLKVPNAALRFRPNRNNEQNNPASPSLPRKEQQTSDRSNTRLYLYRDQALVAVKIRAGITDNTYTEIVSGDVQEGDQVILGEKSTAREGVPKGFSMRLF